MANESEYSCLHEAVQNKIIIIFFFSSLPAVADVLDRANAASLFYSFHQLLEKVDVAMYSHIQKPVAIQVFDNV